MDFWQWQQPLYDGTTGTFECVTRADSAAVLCFLDERTVLLTKQEQPHKPKPFFDLPGGRVDTGESMTDAVQSELTEETGYSADRWMEWYRFQQVGMTRFEEGFFIATGLQRENSTHQDAGERIQAITLTWDELVQMCLCGELRNIRASLAILAMEYEPAARERLHAFLTGV
jgi:ADP-ribose pyrophosphatase